MENMWKWEQGTLVSELIQGMELAKQLRLHLGASSSSVESRDLLLQKILSSYENALLILKLSRPTEQPQQNVGGITCVPESPLTINGSPRSDGLEKDNQDIRDVSKKRWICMLQVNNSCMLLQILYVVNLSMLNDSWNWVLQKDDAEVDGSGESELWKPAGGSSWWWVQLEKIRAKGYPWSQIS